MFARLGIPKKIVFFNDPSHGYYQIPKSTLEKLRISSKISEFSKPIGSNVLLEEDMDMSTFVDALKLKGLKLSEGDFTDKYFDDPNENPASIDFGLCHICGSSFTDADRLRHHKKTVHGIAP